MIEFCCEFGLIGCFFTLFAFHLPLVGTAFFHTSLKNASLGKRGWMYICSLARGAARLMGLSAAVCGHLALMLVEECSVAPIHIPLVSAYLHGKPIHIACQCLFARQAPALGSASIAPREPCECGASAHHWLASHVLASRQRLHKLLECTY